MASALNRATKEYRESINTPDYPAVDWIINPDLSGVTGYPSKYWTITDDDVTLMSLEDRNAVDAAERDAFVDNLVNSLTDNDDLTRAVALRIRDEFEVRATEYNSLLDTIQSSATFSDLKSAAVNMNRLTVPSIEEILAEVKDKIGVEV